MLHAVWLSHLFTLDLGPDGGLEHQVLQDGGEGRHSDSSSHQNRNLVVRPLLMAFAKRAIQVQLQEEDVMICNWVPQQQVEQTE